MAKERSQPIVQSMEVPNLAFPNNAYIPSALGEFCNLGSVSCPIRGNFPYPVGAIILGNSIAPRTVMPVPETTVDEDRFLERGKYDIGLAGKVAAMQTVTKALLVK